MKSKVITRAMAVLLAVVMSFSLIIPETFATSNDSNDDVDAISVETESVDNGEKTMGEKYRDGEIDRETWLNSLPDDQYNKETREFYIPGDDGEIITANVDDFTVDGIVDLQNNENNTQMYSNNIQTYADGMDTTHTVTIQQDINFNFNTGGTLNCGYFEIDDGTVAWCCEHANYSPIVNTTMTTIRTYTGDSIFCRLAYYGYYGPEYSKGKAWVENYIYNICPWLAAANDNVDWWAYALEALAFSLNNPNYTDHQHTDSEYTYGGAYTDWVQSMDYPGGITVYELTSGQSGYQNLMYWTAAPSTGYIKIIKTTSNSGTSNNYDMSGAQYTVYNDYACTDIAKDANGNNAIMTISKTSSGTYESNVLEMNIGTYYVKETKEPDGFSLDSKIYTAEVSTDYTANDPLIIYSTDYRLGSFLDLEKTSSNPEFTNNNNCYSFAGAEYTVFTDSSCNQIAQTFDFGDGYGTHQAVFVIDENGQASDKNWNGGSANQTSIALYAGHYYVKETKLPDPVGDNTESSYGWDTTVYEVDMTSNPNDHIKISASDPPGNDPISLSIQKDPSNISAEDAPSLAGAQFLIQFYGGNYTEAEIDAGKPASDGVQTRTWVIETLAYMDSRGNTHYNAGLDDEHIVSSTTVNGVTYTSDKLYYDDGTPTIPYGTITIEELQAPDGYSDEGAWSEQTINGVTTTTGLPNNRILYHIEEDLGYFQDLTISYVRTDPIDIWGGLTVPKIDMERDENVPQGDATLAGAEYTIYYNGDEPVTYTDKKTGEEVTIIPNEPVITIVTDEDGYATTAGSPNVKQSSPVLGDINATTDNTLLYGRYYVKETKASEGYLLNEDFRYDFFAGAETDENGNVVRDSDGAVEFVENAITVSSDGAEQVIRGGFEIVKRDLESGRDVAEGGASLKNAELTLINRSENAVLVKSELYEPGEVIMVLYTNDDGYASVDNDTLPYGTYEIVETQAPEGYLPHDQYKENDKDDGEPVGVLTRNFVIRTDGEMVDLTDYTYDFDINDYVYCAEGGDAIYNQVIRADFAIRKIDSDTQKKMTGVIFKIESETTHEYHYFMTDENGAYSSAVDYAEHTHNTNYHDDESTWDETDIKQLENHCGMWFYGYDDPDSTQIDNSLGALPYDTYTITEIKTEANKNHVMWEDTFTVGPNDNNIVIDLNDIENTTWDIDTVATFESTNSKYAPVSENTITIDAVSYENLTIGHEYTLVAKLYDKNTQNFVKNAYGEDVMSVTAFTPRLHFGTANTEIVFDSTGLDGHDIVVFEYVYDGDDLMKDPVLYETDPEAADQTLHFPEIQTTALDAETGTHTSYAGGTITIVDTVEYSNLQPGREYTVTGTLMNQKTGEPVLTADGEEITSEATFTPDEPDGYVTVVFDFDGTGLEGVVTVVFEHVYYKGVEYAAHADINDEGQTVYIPKIHTTAWAEETGINAASAGEDITLYDTVAYKGVESGQEYHIFSVLFNAETHEAEVDSDGNEIWSDYGPFTAEESEGRVDVEFNIDASLMEGHRTVFYEILYQVETDEETGEITYTLIAEEDLADVPDETIYFPNIHTNAWDSETGTNIMEARENVTLVDTVTYTNLAPGHEYTVTGVLMDKETGEAILDAEGNEVTSEASFTPEESDGTVEVEFTFDATGLEGTAIVVFEDLYYEDIQLTTHADLEDEDQTVYVPEIHTTAIAESTGTHEVTAEGSVTIVDTVEYTNLLPGKTYTMSGELMDASSGDSLGITGNTVFTPEEPDGTVDVTFTFDADEMADKTVVVFEECSIAAEDEDVPVAEHKDLTDTDQQVKLTAPPTTDTPTGTPTSTNSPKTGQIAGFSALGVALAAAGAAFAGTVARKKRTGAGA